MAGDVGEFHRKWALEVSVEKLVVASAHTRRGDLQQDLTRLWFGHGNLFDPKRLPVSVHPGCSHPRHVCLALAGNNEAARAGRRGHESGSGVAPRPPLPITFPTLRPPGSRPGTRVLQSASRKPETP